MNTPIKTLIVKNTFINGVPVSAGDVIEADNSIFGLLSENRKAVAFDKATDEQKSLIKKGVK